MSRLGAILLAILLARMPFPSVAFACSSCNDPKDQGQAAFLGPTIFMSLLPLTMLGAIGGYLWWRARRASTLNSSFSP